MVLLRHRQQRSNTVKWKIPPSKHGVHFKVLIVRNGSMNSPLLCLVLYYVSMRWVLLLLLLVFSYHTHCQGISVPPVPPYSFPKHESGVAGAWEAPGELLGASTKYHLTPTRSRNTAPEGDHICVCSWWYAARVALPYRLLLFILYCVAFITKASHRCSDAGTEKQHRQGLEP